MEMRSTLIYNEQGKSIGARISVFENPISLEQKVVVERNLFDKALEVAQGNGLSAFRSYYGDMMGLVVFWDNE